MDLNELSVLHQQALVRAVRAVDEATRDRYQSVANLFSETIVRRQRDAGRDAVPPIHIMSGNAQNGHGFYPRVRVRRSELCGQVRGSIGRPSGA